MIIFLTWLQTGCLFAMAGGYVAQGNGKLAVLSALYGACNAVVFLWK